LNNTIKLFNVEEDPQVPGASEAFVLLKADQAGNPEIR
jgi:hypothetical protein